MPIIDDVSPRKFITKVWQSSECPQLHGSADGTIAVYNFCKSGAMSHNEVLDLYKKFIDADS